MLITGPITSVIGIDSGKTVGISFLDYDGDRIAGMTLLQVEHVSAQLILDAMLIRHYADPERVRYRFAGVESFVTGQSAGTKGKPAELTRQLVFEISQQLQAWGYHVVPRKAAEVKVWATDKKLEAIGVHERCSINGDMNHAADSMRHALFAAVHDARKPNPLR